MTRTHAGQRSLTAFMTVGSVKSIVATSQMQIETVVLVLYPLMRS